MRLILLLLLTIALSACPSPDTPSDPREEEVTGDDGATEGDEEEGLPRVTGLRATVEEGAVVLGWDPVDDAENYRIYRDTVPLASPLRSSVSAPSPAGADSPGDMIGMSGPAGFTDFDAGTGVTATYRVAARVEAGVGPASDPVTVSLTPFVIDWLTAPAPFAEEEPPLIGVPGGDEGLATTTPFPDSDVSADCSVEEGAYAIRSFRPALDDLLGDGFQTFSVTFAYNVTLPTEYIEYDVVGFSGSELRVEALLFEEHSQILSGCGEKTVSYTVDMDAVDGDGVTFGAAMEKSPHGPLEIQLHYFPREGVPWARLVNLPPDGSPLTGAPLPVTVEYGNQDAGTYEIRLIRDLESYYASTLMAQARLLLDGTGEKEILLSYPEVCLPEGEESKASLTLSRPRVHNWFPSGVYPIASTGPVEVTWTEKEHYLREEVEQSKLVRIRSCDGYEQPVTVSTYSPSLAVFAEYREGWAVMDSGASVSGTTEGSFYVAADMGQAQPGSYPLDITVEAAGRLYSLPATFHVYDIWWDIVPPLDAVGHTDYEVRLATEGTPPPWLEMLVWSYHDQNRHLELPYDETIPGYAGSVSFTACADYELWLSNVRQKQWRELEVDVEVSLLVPPRLLWGSTRLYFNAQNPAPQDLVLTMACGEATDWRIVSASEWLRFDRLEGTVGEAVKVKPLADGTYHSMMSGDIEIRLDEVSEPYRVRVFFQD